MIRNAGKLTLAAMLAGAMSLGGCATTDSVKRAQESADAAMAAANGANGAAQRAQSSADAAGAAAQHAQQSADAAAGAAQAAASQAQATSARVDELNTRVEQMQVQRRAPARHRRGHRAAPATGATAGERG